MQEYLDQTCTVREEEQLDLARLEAFFSEHRPGGEGRLAIEQFPQGYSNLTYLIRWGDEQLVLRRPPFGNLVKSAHDMGREYRVLSKLCKVYPLAPNPFLYCEDTAVLGVPFYVMERRHGVVLRKKLPPGLELPPETARELSESIVDNLALLHGVDYQAAGLSDFGRPEGYVERQVTGWIKRYDAAQTDTVPAMDRLGGWLADNRPPDSGAALIHNDYKHDNLLLDADNITRIIAVFDWEMSTIGDPLMDLGSTLAYWVQADDPPPLVAASFGPTYVPGSFTRCDIVARYEQKTGKQVDGVLFYYCYGLYKLAVIIQQIYARFKRGSTKDPRFAILNQQVRLLGEVASAAMDRGTV